ncbi:hypothetical protein ACRE_068700 [Hapsidospora chrysogenum ATCC 11550]|uniref:15-hydroxyprostaglandin dehydrogenase [NAD(+)]-like protein n=1 Tax=Hapsidospora chrysogenum (strain ATCC 11550 / CBS 779.69 / DSM 880 / IAM 14645 / JCM 23072 / IMI 49137) TaxID=857340 RepID=A0A086SZ79_HAPC1|nr:hypothetical protein ACRE_068700 [Hapsidospora chrysogenum ATCC 11550]
MAESQVALVTGGGAGMGLATATKLIESGWKVIIVDLNNETGLKAAEGLGKNATFVQADVTKWDDQVGAFEHAVELHGQINFVFANAGIAGRAGFYDAATTWPPERPSLIVEEVCLKGVVYTSYLAMHYMRGNKPSGGVIVTTASGVHAAASIYTAPDLPLYTAAKHGVLGLMRAMSHQLKDEGIRVNSILPGAIRTTLYSDDIWTQFPKDDFTPVEEVVNTVMSLVSDETATGRAMEISAGETFDRRQPEYCNETMRRIMEGKSY